MSKDNGDALDFYADACQKDLDGATLFYKDNLQNGGGEWYPMGKDEEYRLITLAQAGDKEALDKIVLHNIPLVWATAKQFSARTMSTMDLMQEGVCGLIEAVHRFDLSRGVVFSTYAVPRIQKCLSLALRSGNDRALRLPHYMQKAERHLRKLEAILFRETGTSTPEQMMAEILVPAWHIQDVAARLTGVISYDGEINSDGAKDSGGQNDDLAIMESMKDDGKTPEEVATEQSLTDSIRRALNCLRPKERIVLTMHYGLDGKEPRTLRQIGEQLGYTYQNCSLIERQALDKLRNSSLRRYLVDYVE